MNTEMLREEFENILSHEERAKNFYDHYIDQIDDENVKKQLISIRDDEVRHMKFAKQLIDCVK